MTAYTFILNIVPTADELRHAEANKTTIVNVYDRAGLTAAGMLPDWKNVAEWAVEKGLWPSRYMCVWLSDPMTVEQFAEAYAAREMGES